MGKLIEKYVIPGMIKPLMIFHDPEKKIFYTTLRYKIRESRLNNSGFYLKEIDLAKEAKTIPLLLEKVKDEFSIQKNGVDRRHSNFFWQSLVYLTYKIKEYNSQINSEAKN